MLPTSAPSGRSRRGNLASASPCSAQVTPAAGYTPPDDTPSIRVGVTIFADYTYQDKPRSRTRTATACTLSSSTWAGAYINVTGNIIH